LLASAEAMSIGVRTQGGRTLEYRTSVLGENEKERSFSIYVPPDLWDRLTPGQIVLVKASLPGSFLLFDAKVVSLEEKPVARAVLAAVEQGRVRRIQRRQHFRVPAIMPVKFTFERPDAKVPERVETLNATTFDVSAGGVGIVIDRSKGNVVPGVHTRGKVELTLGPGDSRTDRNPPSTFVVRCDARIARLEEVPNTSMLRLGVDFQSITEPQRMELSRFVIARQLALRRKGTR
jgi:c-di-GMP-binding flagellar brake protein YcgR